MKTCTWCAGRREEPVSWHEVFGIEREHPLCFACRNRLSAVSEPICNLCGRTLNDLDAGYVKENTCFDCVRWEEGGWSQVLVKNRSLFRYNEFLQASMARFKYRGDAEMAKGWEPEWRDLYRKEFSGCVAVPVPLSRERLMARGFNQSVILAELLPAECVHGLKRIVHEEKQSKKTREERLDLTEAVFAYAGEREQIEGKRAVIVDDVYTTGTTVRRAANCLLAAGAKSVCSMTVARG
ncbi:MAG TPA: ComF family protein [Bacillales bacterium]|nr:ComF family protein [Bacillales bacterium]